MSRSVEFVCVVVGALGLLAWVMFCPRADPRSSTGEARGVRVASFTLRVLAPGLCFALLLSSYMTKGHLIPGDAQSHLGRSWLTLDALRHGELPVWSNRWYMGFPLDLYYGPLFHFTAALFVGLLGGKLFFAGKLLLWITHVGSALTAYRLGLSRYGERSSALLLAAGYALAGYHIDALRTDGKLPLALIFLSAPALLMQLERVARDPARRARASLTAALLMAAAFAAHVQYGGYLVGTYVAASAVDGLLARGAHRIAILRHVLEAGATMLGLSLWLLVPILEETAFLTLGHGDAGIYLELFDPHHLFEHVKVMLTLMPERPRHIEGYLGLSLVALTLVAVVRPTRDEGGARRLAYPLVFALFGLAAVCLRQCRCDLLIFFGVSVLAVDGFTALSRTFSPRILAPAALSLILLDFGAGLVKDEYPVYDVRVHRRTQRLLAKSGVPGRVLSVYRGRYTFWPGLENYRSGLSTPLGSIPQLSTRSLGYTLAITTHVARELIDEGHDLSERSRDLLQLIGVRYLLVGDRRKRIETRVVPPLLYASQLGQATPIEELENIGLAGADLYALREIPTDHVLWVAQQMALSPTEPQAERILVMDDVLGVRGPQAGGPRSELAPAQLRVSRFVERHGSVELRYALARPGFLRLAYSHAPYGVMAIDGAPVPFSRDALGALVVAAPAGEHALSWRVGISPLRVRMLALSGLTALFVVACYWPLRRREALCA